MVLPDVNILIYSFRPDAVHHQLCRAWLNSVVAGDAPFGISPLTLNALVRITTNPRIYHLPNTLDESFGFCQDLMDQPHCRLVEPGDRHWSIFRKVCEESNTTGPRVSDAWFAALAIEHGCEWVTLDRDFARFAGLKRAEPTAY